MRRFFAAALTAALLAGLLPLHVLAADPQTISFTSPAPAAAVVGGLTYTPTADATSGLPVTITVDAGAGAVCSIAAGVVSFQGAGSCVLNADQPGDALWDPAPQVQQSFAVGPGSQTVSFTSTAPAAAVVGGPTYTPTATATSGLPVTITVDAGAGAVCSIAAGVVSFQGAGSCVLNADQAGDGNWDPAPQVQQSFAVGKGSQTVSFSSVNPGTVAIGATYNLAATATSGLAATFAIDPSTTNDACSLAGATVTFDHAGTCVVNALQAGNANWNAATPDQQSISVAKTPQTVTITSTTPAAAVVDGPTYTPAATGGASGNPVVFSIDASSTPGTCSVAAGIVSFHAVGTCVLNADQAGSADYAAGSDQQSFAVGKGGQTISFTSSAPAATVEGPTYTPTASGGASANPVSFTIDASTASACSIAAGVVSFHHVGPCLVNANQAGDDDYEAAPQQQQAVTIGQGSQTISFTSTAPVAPTAFETYDVTATSTSGLAVTFSIDAAASSICSISGATVTFLAVGACVINADQAGDVDWLAAPTAQQTVGVGDVAPVCTLASATARMNVLFTGAVDCTDHEDDALTYELVDDATNGTAGVQGATWSYTSDATYTGTDSFTYRAYDGILYSEPVTVSVTVQNDPVDAKVKVQNVGPVAPTAIDVLGKSSPGALDAGQPMTITAVTQGSRGRVTTDGAVVTYDPSGCATGTDLFTFTISDGRTTDTASVAITILRPGQGGLSSVPVTDTPAVGLSTGGTIGSKVPVKVGWCAVVKSGAGVKGYRVEQSANAGASYTVVTSSTTARSIVRPIGTSATYAWRVRTTDSASRVGAFRSSATAKASILQETATPGTVEYLGTWRTTSTSKASGGRQVSSGSTAASVTITVAAGTRQVGIVGPKGSGYGSFKVWIDGAYAGVFSEKASSTVYKRILLVKSVNPATGHTIVLKPAGNGQAYLDAIVTLQ